MLAERPSKSGDEATDSAAKLRLFAKLVYVRDEKQHHGIVPRAIGGIWYLVSGILHRPNRLAIRGPTCPKDYTHRQSEKRLGLRNIPDTRYQIPDTRRGAPVPLRAVLVIVLRARVPPYLYGESVRGGRSRHYGA